MVLHAPTSNKNSQVATSASLHCLPPRTPVHRQQATLAVGVTRTHTATRKFAGCYKRTPKLGHWLVRAGFLALTPVSSLGLLLILMILIILLLLLLPLRVPLAFPPYSVRT